jgi:protein required for attachment to host cells
MSEPILRRGIWVAVCDGGRALLLENQGDAAFPKLETRTVFKQDNPPAHSQGSGPPGRAFGPGERRGTTEESDYHEQQAEAFLGRFADTLNRQVEEGHIHALVLVAPARALGILRPRLSELTRRAVSTELDRDYVKMPVYEIERKLTGLSQRS